jgi:hypothetical protein
MTLDPSAMSGRLLTRRWWRLAVTRTFSSHKGHHNHIIRLI